MARQKNDGRGRIGGRKEGTGSGIHRLTAKEIMAKKPPGLYADGGGLYLRVAPGGSKSWMFRYMFSGTAHNVGLGDIHSVPADEAREHSKALHTIVRAAATAGADDPMAQLRAFIIDRAKAKLTPVTHTVPTFGETLDQYIARKEVAWRRGAEAANWRSMFDLHGKSLLAVPVDELETPEIRRALDPVFAKSFKLGRKLQNRIEQVMGFATAEGHRKGENPARWKQHLATIFHAPETAKATKNHEAMDYRTLPPFITELRTADDVKARAIEFLILTAARRGEVARDEKTIGMQWSEVDFDKAVWTIPPSRMKKGRQHVVPLSARAVAILRNMEELATGGAVFPISQSSMAKHLAEVRPGVTLHGFRSTFATWAQDETDFPSETVMHCIAHIEGTASDLAYKRGDAVEKRRAIMAAWAGYCDGQATVAAAA